MTVRLARFLLIAVSLLSCAAALSASPQDSAACAKLALRALPNATIVSAGALPAGAFTPPQRLPDAPGPARALPNLPAFCRVALKLAPTRDSDIHSEVWLPLNGWNSKYEAVGNGGWGGAIVYSALAEALRRGYATSSTDDGTAAVDNSFLIAQPDRFIDFAYRSEHETTLKAKALILAFYGKSPRYSYWNGCSGGGREGLLQAYRYPEDFNGIVAGDPADFRRNAWALYLANASFKNPDDYIPPAKYSMIHQAVLDDCDKLDGLVDGLIGEPRACRFDPAVLLCKGADGPSCLTARQVQTARTILNPMKSSSGVELFPRLEPGTELRWARLAGGPAPAGLFVDYFKFIVHKDASWDWKTFRVDRDAALADKAAKGIVALEPDLTRFAGRGGKLILYHGWADQQVAPQASIEFYDAMAADLRRAGISVDDSARLFMVPGMAHCGGGEGPDQFDKMQAIEDWVEQSKPPETIVASRKVGAEIVRTRPLCPYPKHAEYNGNGSIDAAENFSCRAPR